jgi:hypothetical protein
VILHHIGFSEGIAASEIGMATTIPNWDLSGMTFANDSFDSVAGGHL